MTEKWKITSEAERAWLRSALGRGGGAELVQTLAAGGSIFPGQPGGGCSAPEAARNRFRRTPLHIAADYGWDTAVGILLGPRPGDTAATDAAGDTAAHLAIQSGVHDDTLRRLLQHPVKTVSNMRNKVGNTPLHIAALCRRPDAVRVLLEADANFDLENDDGVSALQIAIRRESQDSVDHIEEAVRWRVSGVAMCVLAGCVAVTADDIRCKRNAYARTPTALTQRAYELLDKETRRRSLPAGAFPTHSTHSTPHSAGGFGAGTQCMEDIRLASVPSVVSIITGSQEDEREEEEEVRIEEEVEEERVEEDVRVEVEVEVVGEEGREEEEEEVAVSPCSADGLMAALKAVIL